MIPSRLPSSPGLLLRPLLLAMHAPQALYTLQAVHKQCKPGITLAPMPQTTAAPVCAMSCRPAARCEVRVTRKGCTCELGLHTLHDADNGLIELLLLSEDGDVVAHHTVHKVVTNGLQRQPCQEQFCDCPIRAWFDFVPSHHNHADCPVGGDPYKSITITCAPNPPDATHQCVAACMSGRGSGNKAPS